MRVSEPGNVCKLFMLMPLMINATCQLCDMEYSWGVVGVLGIKVKIMLPWDQTGKIGPKKPLPDNVSIVEPKEESAPATPYSESKQAPAVAPPQQQQAMGGGM